MDYLVFILILICIYSVLALSLDLLVGHLGLLSLTHAGLAGIGAYASALLSLELGIPFTASILIGAVIALMVSLLVSIPSLRLHDDYFVIGTFGFQVILFSIVNNWTELTHGPLGIPDVPRPRLLWWSIDTDAEFLILAAGVLILTWLLVYRIVHSPLGRVLHAIREDEVFTKALGKNVVTTKIAICAMSAALAAVAGALYAHFITYIHPSNFAVHESILILSMVVIGGAGSKWGPIIGACVLVGLPELLRFVGLPSSVASNMREILYGLALVVMMMFRPRGLVGTYAFGR